MTEAFETANELFAKQNFEGAVKYFNKALDDVPEEQQYVVHSNKGAALMNLGRIEDAIESFDLALESSPEHIESLHNKGVAYSAIKKFDDAVECFDQAIAVSPDFFASHCGKSEALSSLENYEDAVEAAQDAIAVDASQAVAYADLGFAYLKLRKFDKAVEAYRKGVSHGDETAETKRLLGIALSEQALELEADGDVAEAIALYDEAIKNHAEPQAYHNQGILYVRQNKEKKAISCFKKALKEDKEYFESLAALGALYAKADKPGDAVDYLERAVEANPDSTETRYNLGLVYLKLEKDIEAKEQFKAVLAEEPDNAEVVKAMKLLNKDGIVKRNTKVDKKNVSSVERSFVRDVNGAKKASGSKKKGKSKFYKLKDLQQAPFPDGVDPTCRQNYLSNDDFEALFKLSKDEFDALPQWKQVREKKANNLF